MTSLSPPDPRVASRPVATGRRRSVDPSGVLAAIAVGAVAVAVWPLAQFLRIPQPIPLYGLLAHVSGMLAGYGVVVLIGLMSRAPALERGVGADRLSRWHGRGGRIVVLLVLVQVWAAVAA